MRLMFEFSPLSTFDYHYVDKHKVQSFIYGLLRGTDFDDMHSRRGFKFFCFSDIFPISDFIEGESKKLIVSSPNIEFIKTLRDSIDDKGPVFALGNKEIEVVDLRVFELDINGAFITGSPIVLHIDNQRSFYFTLRRKPDINFFLNRVKDNALKKYNAFYGKDFYFEGPIFNRLVYRKDVATVIWKNNKKITILGTVWEELTFREILSRIRTQEIKQFYKFIMDAGLGEKNSLGFGFVNPKKTK